LVGRSITTGINLLAEVLDPLLRRQNRKADILPIVYLVRATAAQTPMATQSAFSL
jgi:hypothetical protein